MRATGIIRRIDDLGRIVIPKDIRATLNIHEGTPMEFCIDNGSLVLTKYEDRRIQSSCDDILDVINSNDFTNDERKWEIQHHVNAIKGIISGISK